VEKIYQAYNSEGNNGFPTVTTVTQYGFLDVGFSFEFKDGSYLLTVTVTNTSGSPASGYTTGVKVEAMGVVDINVK
jgi:hypothetical protein